jgi:outer membrane protein
MASRRAARFASADELETLDQQQAAGEKLTPTFVQLKLDSQDRLAEAERQESLAISNYNIAIAHLEKAKGTLLRYNNVLLAEQPAMLTQ